MKRRSNKFLFEWVAEHLVKFEPGMCWAHLTFIDDDGEEQKVKWRDSESDDTKLPKLLRGCIEEAIKFIDNKPKT
jgi:hypothetical protein